MLFAFLTVHGCSLRSGNDRLSPPPPCTAGGHSRIQGIHGLFETTALTPQQRAQGLLTQDTVLSVLYSAWIRPKTSTFSTSIALVISSPSCTSISRSIFTPPHALMLYLNLPLSLPPPFSTFNLPLSLPLPSPPQSSALAFIPLPIISFSLPPSYPSIFSTSLSPSLSLP